MRKRFLVARGAGFIPFVRHGRSEHDVLVVDELTCAGHLDSLAPIKGHPRFEFVRVDVRDAAKIAASRPERTPDRRWHRTELGKRQHG
jgi:dTDP-glucose 4,6-dehydratase